MRNDTPAFSGALVPLVRVQGYRLFKRRPVDQPCQQLSRRKRPLSSLQPRMGASQSVPLNKPGHPRPGLGPVPTGRTRIICVGDIHDHWDALDEAAITASSPDVILFVGDFGNENVHLVERIATFSKGAGAFVAAVLGNHDGFYSMSDTGRRNCPYNGIQVDRVKQQLELLQPFNPSYRSMPVDGTPCPMHVVGGRPLTWGGPNWKHAAFYRKYFGVQGMNHSSELISSAAVGAGAEHVLFLSHNGPTGLGEKPNDPCGKDFGQHIGGDHGDADLRAGIEAARRAGKAVPLVVFGHMHQRLQRGGQRTMMKKEPDGSSGRQTVMLDAAVVPRHRNSPSHVAKVCQFTVVEIGPGGLVDTVEQVWMKSSGEIVESNVLLDEGGAAAGADSMSMPAARVPETFGPPHTARL